MAAVAGAYARSPAGEHIAAGREAVCALRRIGRWASCSAARKASGWCRDRQSALLAWGIASVTKKSLGGLDGFGSVPTLGCPLTGAVFVAPMTHHFKEREMKVRPLQDRVLVKRVESETRSAGGIIIPDTAKEKPLEGIVIAVGEGKRLEDGTRVAPEVKAGDRVLFGKYAGTEIKVGTEDHMILKESDILGILE